MSQYDTKQLKAMLDKHDDWLRGDGGERANLRGANLCYATLCNANLRGANLCYADLRDANLSHADLGGATLRGANLRYANLYNINLRDADLHGATLCDANLRNANLYNTNLRDTDLRGATLCDANLCGADLTAYQICHGKLSVWKKASGCMVNLEIPEEAKRTASIVGRKCRAEYAKVLAIFDKDGEPVTTVHGDFNKTLIYTVGETVYPDKYDDDPRIECTHGIHFFQTRKEAEEY